MCSEVTALLCVCSGEMTGAWEWSLCGINPVSVAGISPLVHGHQVIAAGEEEKPMWVSALPWCWLRGMEDSCP